VIIPLRRVGAGGDQEKVTFLAPALEVAMKFWGGTIGSWEREMGGPRGEYSYMHRTIVNYTYFLCSAMGRNKV